MNYFEYYNIDPSFRIDQQQLKQAYKKKMLSLHPDLHMDKSEVEKEDKLRESSFNNDAYNTLKDDVLRINYILDNFSKSPRKTYKLPSFFLMEMMEYNDEILSSQNDEVALNEIRTKVEDLIEINEKLKDEVFEQSYFKLEVTDQEMLEQYLVKKKYFNRLLNNISGEIEL